MSHYRNPGSVPRCARAALAALALGLASTGVLVVGPAGASGYSMTLSGPATNTMGSDFNYVIAGVAGGPADRVVAWEQFNKAGGCAPTFAAESFRALFTPASVYELTVWVNQAVSGSYSVTAAFGARNPGVHGVCAYLVSASTGTTYAHAGAFWTNVSASA